MAAFDLPRSTMSSSVSRSSDVQDLINGLINPIMVSRAPVPVAARVGSSTVVMLLERNRSDAHRFPRKGRGIGRVGRNDRARRGLNRWIGAQLMENPMMKSIAVKSLAIMAFGLSVCAAVPASAEEVGVGVGVGRSGVTVGVAPVERERDRTVIREREPERDRTVIIRKDREDDRGRDRDVIIDRR